MSNENFFQVDKQELAQEEKLLFEGKVPVRVYVRDCQEIAGKDGKPASLKLSCVAKDGEHVDKAFSIWVRKDFANSFAKRRFLSLAKAFFTDEELEKGLANAAKMIGQELMVTPSVPREHQGKTYQDFSGFERVETTTSPTNFVDEDKIPF